MALSAKEAAEAVGMSKPGLLKAIRLGKLSATKDLNGEWQIEPVELFRVYQPVKAAQVVEVPEESHGEVREVELLREMLRDRDDVISDLRRRLDAEADERRKLTLILTDQSHQKRAVEKGFWERLFGSK